MERFFKCCRELKKGDVYRENPGNIWKVVQSNENNVIVYIPELLNDLDSRWQSAKSWDISQHYREVEIKSYS